MEFTEKDKQRFWSRVQRGGDDECWPWIAGTGSDGYGQIIIDGRKVRAHRVSWELFNGAIPHSDAYPGTCICHHCDNPPCVNPKHLFMGSHSDNMRDRAAKGRNNCGGAVVVGEESYCHKLTEQQVREIRSHTEISSAEFGRRVGVCKSVVLGIRAGRKWRHVT